MQNLVFKILLFSIPLFCFISCQDEISLEKNDEIDNGMSARIHASFPEILDNRLHFDNFEDFENYMDVIADEEPNVLDGINEEFEFYSWEKVLESNTEADLPSDINNLTETYIEDPWLRRVLNYNQEISVGELICRVEDDYVYIYVKGHFEEIRRFENSNQIIEYNTAELINDKLIAFRPKKEINGSGDRAWIFGYGFRSSTNTISISNNRRMQAKHFAINIFFYKSAGMETNMQKYSGWWIFKRWKKENAKRIETFVNVDLDIVTAGFPISESYSFPVVKFNTDHSTHRIFDVGGIGVSVNGGSISGITGYDGSSFSIKNTSYSNHKVEYGNSIVDYNNKMWAW
jgi:hypothetical protein